MNSSCIYVLVLSFLCFSITLSLYPSPSLSLLYFAHFLAFYHRSFLRLSSKFGLLSLTRSLRAHWSTIAKTLEHDSQSQTLLAVYFPGCHVPSVTIVLPYYKNGPSCAITASISRRTMFSWPHPWLKRLLKPMQSEHSEISRLAAPHRPRNI